jgi:hypothetical protein
MSPEACGARLDRSRKVATGVTVPGPFDVDPAAVERLGLAFASFVNDLLQAEVARAGLAGYQLDINRQESTADGGVDAALWNSVKTSWLPQGHSAWQFKSADRKPAKCRKELRCAAWARELLEEGATYILVLGRPLVAQTKKARLDALREEAKALGLTNASFRLYDGNQLARWISGYPALALDRRLGGPGPVLLDFERWSGSQEHQERWVRCPSRSKMEGAVAGVATGKLPSYRLEGGTGLGKTRLAMEILRSSPARSLVVYAPRGEQVSTEVLSYLTDADRSCVLVVDNCSRIHHQSILEQVGTRTVRVLTIGIETEERLLRTPLHELSPATDEEIDAILRENVPALWQEAARVVHENCFGNVRTALLLGTRLVETDEQNVTELLRHNDFRQLITTLLPEHADFFSAALLALFEKLGWDRDRRYQLETLPGFSAVPLDQLESTARALESVGLLARQGRYRSVVPQPVAVLLASSAWEQLGDRIFHELAPRCDRQMLEALFHRCAELGRFEPVRSVLNRLLSHEGPYGSLSQIEQTGIAEFLVQMAVVLPDEVTDHLSELIEAADVEDLRRQTRSRRGLVQTLEKLVWHQATFERAADALLKLALAENESWANNATGQWISLFGARLPTTAATPKQRLAYLRRCSRSTDAAIRSLVVRSATSALDPDELAVVSGELQAGTIVAPRGTVRPGREALDYWTGLVEILAQLRADDDADVTFAAYEGLISAIDPFIDVPQVGEAIASVVVTFTGDALRRLRRSLEQRVDLAEPETEPNTALQRLLARLPTPSPLQRLRELAELPPWDLGRDDSRRSELQTLLEVARQHGTLPQIFNWLAAEDLPSAWHVGFAVGALPDPESYVDDLVRAAAKNAPALAGFLAAQVEAGKTEAFDQFLEDGPGATLPPSTRLYLTSAGPYSPKAHARGIQLVAELPVAEGAGHALNLQDSLDATEALELVRNWRSRVQSDRDYAAVVDWMNMYVQRKNGLNPKLHGITLELLRLRRSYPDLGHERWDWCQLAAILASRFPVEIATEVVDLVSEGLLFLESDDEAAVLRASAESAPDDVWSLAAERLESRDWRVLMTLRGWFTTAFPIGVIDEWIGRSADRARLVADIAPAGGDEPDPLAVLLLSRFPDDDKIAGSLAGTFQSGTWFGPWSRRLEAQIKQLQGWRRRADLPLPVRTWAARMIEALERQRVDALQHEAEEL